MITRKIEANAGSGYVPEEDVPAQPQGLLCLRCPRRRRLYAERVIVRRANGWTRHLSVDHLVGSDPGLRQLPGRDLLCSDEIGEVRVVLVPAAELVRLLAHTGVSLTPPRTGLPIKHAVADRLGHGDLAGRTFAAGLAPQGAGKDVAVFIGYSHHFSPDEKNPLFSGLRLKTIFTILLPSQ